MGRKGVIALFHFLNTELLLQRVQLAVGDTAEPQRKFMKKGKVELSEVSIYVYIMLKKGYFPFMDSISVVFVTMLISSASGWYCLL